MLTAVPVSALGGIPHFDVVGEPVALPQDDTPALALYRGWRAYRDWLVSPEGTDRPEEEYDLLVDALGSMEAEMDRLPARTMTDLAAKVLCLSGDGEQALPHEPSGFVDECRAILERV